MAPAHPGLKTINTSRMFQCGQQISRSMIKCKIDSKCESLYVYLMHFNASVIIKRTILNLRIISDALSKCFISLQKYDYVLALL